MIEAMVVVVNNGLGFAWIKNKSHHGAIRISDDRHLAFCRTYHSQTWRDLGTEGHDSWIQVPPKGLHTALIDGGATQESGYDPGNNHYKMTWDSSFDENTSDKL